MGIQIYQNIQLSKTKSEVHKLWDQISTFNTVVAMKLLDTQKEIDKLNNKENKNGK
jgi:cell division protein FtsX